MKIIPHIQHVPQAQQMTPFPFLAAPPDAIAIGLVAIAEAEGVAPTLDNLLASMQYTPASLIQLGDRAIEQNLSMETLRGEIVDWSLTPQSNDHLVAHIPSAADFQEAVLIVGIPGALGSILFG